jgi:hypothetical protein
VPSLHATGADVSEKFHIYKGPSLMCFCDVSPDTQNLDFDGCNLSSVNIDLHSGFDHGFFQKIALIRLSGIGFCPPSFTVTSIKIVEISPNAQIIPQPVI